MSFSRADRNLIPNKSRSSLSPSYKTRETSAYLVSFPANSKYGSYLEYLERELGATNNPVVPGKYSTSLRSTQTISPARGTKGSSYRPHSTPYRPHSSPASGRNKRRHASPQLATSPTFLSQPTSPSDLNASEDSITRTKEERLIESEEEEFDIPEAERDRKEPKEPERESNHSIRKLELQLNFLKGKDETDFPKETTVEPPKKTTTVPQKTSLSSLAKKQSNPKVKQIRIERANSPPKSLSPQKRSHPNHSSVPPDVQSPEIQLDSPTPKATKESIEEEPQKYSKEKLQVNIMTESAAVISLRQQIANKLKNPTPPLSPTETKPRSSSLGEFRPPSSVARRGSAAAVDYLRKRLSENSLSLTDSHLPSADSPSDIPAAPPPPVISSSPASVKLSLPPKATKSIPQSPMGELAKRLAERASASENVAPQETPSPTDSLPPSSLPPPQSFVPPSSPAPPPPAPPPPTVTAVGSPLTITKRSPTSPAPSQPVQNPMDELRRKLQQRQTRPAVDVEQQMQARKPPPAKMTVDPMAELKNRLSQRNLKKVSP